MLALGGNAILKRGEEASFSNQYKNVKESAKSIASLISRRKIKLVITHGNGPQVGEELLRNEYAGASVSPLPLHILTAETQAFVGSMLESAIANELKRKRVKIGVGVILTHVLVDAKDAAFSRPSKPVGPFYSKDELDGKLKEGKFDYVEQGGSYRRVVASPKPLEIMEIDAIRRLLDDGRVVIAGGGGGIPVAKSKNIIEGVSAVIDKDLTSQVIADELGADKLIILTDAEYVYRDYYDKDSKIIKIKAGELSKSLDSFQSGSIKPKVEACIKFIENGGKEAYIGNLFKLDDILERKSGTLIVP